jgi:glycosyltransferase involved in cell wall biosynthesis
MSLPLFVYGFPSLYGGAGTELHHQIPIWQRLGCEVHIIPTNAGYPREALYTELRANGVIIHEANEFSAIPRGAPIFGFCNAEFLDRLDEITAYSTNTVFVNCMSWLFENEKRRMAEGKIRTFLYQNDTVRAFNSPILQALNPGARCNFLTYSPYFDARRFPFIEKRSWDFFGCGRISRQDTDKYSSNTLHIYEYFVAPRLKRGLFLGFDQRSQRKIGKPYEWIRTAADQNECSQQEFYRHCEIILQPMDTTENWPRVGLEAMASGSILIVDNRGGWRMQVRHGVTGWLCNHERDFIYYATKMAYEPDLRLEMAQRAKARGNELAGEAVAMESWGKVLKVIL